MPLECFLYVCIGKPCVAMFSAHAVRKVGVDTMLKILDDPLPLGLAKRLYAASLMYCSVHVLVFLLSVVRRLKKKEGPNDSS